jgi:aryl-alcohol dehydrogenase-like predicted oxidoreductase
MPTSDRICFGTSTFAAGRLLPHKDSAPGIEALRHAADRGIRLVHSNHRLETQWAIAEALRGHPAVSQVRHLVKVEACSDDPTGVRDRVLEAIDAACTRLGVPTLEAVTLEIDRKRTDPVVLDSGTAARRFYEQAALIARETGAVRQVLAYCHSEVDLAAAMATPAATGICGQYNLASPWLRAHLPEIKRSPRAFLGMSPLDRGRLVDAARPGDIDSPTKASLAALEWALDSPMVDAVVITMSSIWHVDEVLAVAEGGGTSLDRSRDSARATQ